MTFFKIILFFILFSILFAAIFLYDASSEDEPDGFRGIKFGTDISDIEGMKFLKENNGLKYYEKIDDKMKIGDTELLSIEYEFWNDKFLSVYILALGYERFIEIRDILFYKFGKCNNFGHERYAWKSPNTDVVYIVLALVFRPPNSYSVLRISDVQLLRKRQLFKLNIEDKKKKTELMKKTKKLQKGVNDF